ncbi:NAD(P)/FAD-dependent oxidoreductase [Sporosalibacterium faouarense]|uniref:NAD(P)/FAD-dependent oxidoreductase n=1 Tax=Sporosalibacterium faouarense TaxID=516123 RepID=UPI00141D5218|nr:NAD(P)/FAD-dependent oxidoreductase [Sporosalibacterium faouarense]MTI48506.1 NAD(P)/FAD-dependent oxidoreductase [Bacillota bacterium]
MKKIVILGGGYGGISAAKKLHKKFKKDDNVQITLIDQNPHHTLLTELHEVAGNRVTPTSLLIDLKRVFKSTKVNVVQDKITDVDLEGKELKSSKEIYDFDYLVLGVGSEPAYFNIPGMQDHAFTLWSMKDASKIRTQVLKMFEKASKESSSEKRKSLLTFVVGGGGFTGIEVLGELVQWTKVLAKEYDIDPNEIQLKVVEAMDKILPVLPDSLVKKATRFLEKKNVEVLTSTMITGVSDSKVDFKDGSSVETNTLIWTGGVKANDFAKQIGLDVNRKGRILVNDYLQTNFENVYAIGDNADFRDEGKESLPALVETAMQTGKCAAENIYNDIKSKEKKEMELNLHGVMVSIGSKYGVADTMGLRTSGIIAILFKHMINLHYLFEIAGFGVVFEYMIHHFIEKNYQTNLFEKELVRHAGAKTYAFFLPAVRMFLGVMWLREGLHKLGYNFLRAGDNGFIWFAKDSWLANWWNTLAIQVPNPPADVTSGASLMNLIGDHTPGWYEWFTNLTVYNAPMFFQKMVVIIELGLGLAFLFGAFTFIAGIISTVMMINFAISTGISVDQYWFIFASISCMSGSGRAFGLDAYIIPYAEQQWRYFADNRGIRLNPFRPVKKI